MTILVGLVVVMFTFVRFLSGTNGFVTKFPDACATTKPNCVRLVPGSYFRNDNVTAPVFGVACDVLHNASRDWIDEQSGGSVMFSQVSSVRIVFFSNAFSVTSI